MEKNPSKFRELLDKYHEIIMYLIFGVATTVVSWIVYGVAITGYFFWKAYAA